MDILHPDEEITKQSTVHSTLRARRNSLVPIHRLPIETLTAIFILCARDFYYSKRPGLPDSKLPSWVNISYVCRYWRILAINLPTLWSYVFMTSRRWTEEILARSRQVSLKISLGEAPRRVFERVVDHVERIEELSCRFPLDCDHLFFSSFFSAPAPRLQNLMLSEFQAAEESSSLPFKGYTPALHTLNLTSCSVPWYSFTLNRLTTLILHEVPERFELHVVELLPVLGNMPHLVHLVLDEALASARDTLSSGTYTTAPRVSLSHLAYVEIMAQLSTIVVFLSCVIIPLKARLTLDQADDGEDYIVDEYTSLLSLLLQRFSTPGDPALTVPIIRSLGIHIQPDWDRLAFAASESEQMPYWHDLREHDSRCILQVTLIPLDEDRLIANICQSIPRMDLQSLFFIYSPQSSELWKGILGQFPNLRYIMLEKGLPDGLAPLLSFVDVKDENIGLGHGRKLVPLLEELELHEIRFSTRKDAEAGIIGLQDALSTRAEPQCRFIMAECYVLTSLFDVMFDSIGRWEGEEFKVTSHFYDDHVEGEY